MKNNKNLCRYYARFFSHIFVLRFRSDKEKRYIFYANKIGKSIITIVIVIIKNINIVRIKREKLISATQTERAFPNICLIAIRKGLCFFRVLKCFLPSKKCSWKISNCLNLIFTYKLNIDLEIKQIWKRFLLLCYCLSKWKFRLKFIFLWFWSNVNFHRDWKICTRKNLIDWWDFIVFNWNHVLKRCNLLSHWDVMKFLACLYIRDFA